jgi:hypothetical protein
MPEFESYVDVDVDEFVSSCSKREIQELIECLVEDGYLPKNVIGTSPNENLGTYESIFNENLDKLKEKYYSLNSEDEQVIQNIFKKYL